MSLTRNFNSFEIRTSGISAGIKETSKDKMTSTHTKEKEQRSIAAQRHNDTTTMRNTGTVTMRNAAQTCEDAPPGTLRRK